jgi:acetyl esterase
MPLHPTAQAMVDQMPAGAAMPEITPQTVGPVREFMAAVNADMAGTGPELASVEDRTIPGPGGDLPIRIYTPDGDVPLPVTMWFHGGGFFAGSIDEHDTACRQLAVAAGSIVVGVGYRLAPEHRHPAAADDCFAALRWVARHAAELGGDPDRLAVAGDSAGGNLAAVVALRARDAGGPALRFQLLVYPVVDAAEDSDSAREFHILPIGGKARALQVYAGDGDLHDPDITPINATVGGLPPTLIVTAEYDALCLDGEAYAARLREAGVPVTLSQYDGMLHGFFTSAGMFDDAQRAVDEAGAALREAFASASADEAR